MRRKYNLCSLSFSLALICGSPNNLKWTEEVFTFCSLLLQGVNPWIEVDGGVTPANAYKVCGPRAVLCKK